MRGFVFCRRSVEYRRIAAVYAEAERIEKAEAQRTIAYFTLLQKQIDEMGIPSPTDYSRSASEVEAQAQRQIDSDRRQRLNHERAARYPWLPLPSEPDR